MPKRCFYSEVLAEMQYANFTKAELLQYAPREKPEPCPYCGAIRTPQWVKRSLGGRGSGCWQWSLIFPRHLQRKHA